MGEKKQLNLTGKEEEMKENARLRPRLFFYVKSSTQVKCFRGKIKGPIFCEEAKGMYHMCSVGPHIWSPERLSS